MPIFLMLSMSIRSIKQCHCFRFSVVLLPRWLFFNGSFGPIITLSSYKTSPVWGSARYYVVHHLFEKGSLCLLSAIATREQPPKCRAGLEIPFLVLHRVIVREVAQLWVVGFFPLTVSGPVQLDVALSSRKSCGLHGLAAGHHLTVQFIKLERPLLITRLWCSKT